MGDEDEVLELGEDGAFEVPQPLQAAAPALVPQEQHSGQTATGIAAEYDDDPTPSSPAVPLPPLDPGLARLRYPIPSCNVPAPWTGGSRSSGETASAAGAAPGDQEGDTFHDAFEDLSGLVKDAAKAKDMKEQGNTYYLSHQYLDAADCYTLALEFCPTDEDSKAQKAVYFSNRAACHLKLEDWNAVVGDCTDALALKPKYVKALLRRAEAHERLEKYDLAVADLQEMITAPPEEVPPTAVNKAHADIARLKKLHDEKMAQLKDEALGKLKELGNSLLGHFGLSLDNFQVNQDPSGGGGYNISFNK